MISEACEDSIDRDLQAMLRVLMLYETFCKIKLEADMLPPNSQIIRVDESNFEVKSCQRIGGVVDLRLDMKFFAENPHANNGMMGVHGIV